MNFDILWKSIIVIGSLILGLASSVGLIKWRHDNAIEERFERFVQDETGFRIDISPSDPDPDDREIAGI